MKSLYNEISKRYDETFVLPEGQDIDFDTVVIHWLKCAAQLRQEFVEQRLLETAEEVRVIMNGQLEIMTEKDRAMIEKEFNLTDGFWE